MTFQKPFTNIQKPKKLKIKRQGINCGGLAPLLLNAHCSNEKKLQASGE